METLEKLFGGAGKLKVVKLFLFNPESSFDINQVSTRAKVSRGVARREVRNLKAYGFLKSKKVLNKAQRYNLNQKFADLESLHNLLYASSVFKNEELLSFISKILKPSLVIISGIFTNQKDARVDLFMVGEHIKESLIQEVIGNIESKIGKEINYVIFETSEFKYRLSVFDRLIRDVLDYPHIKLVNKLGI